MFSMDPSTSASIISETASRVEDVCVVSDEKFKNSDIERILAQGRRPFEIVLRGGIPWGFALNGGKNSAVPLHVSKIVAGGKASESAMMEGDYVLRVNNVSCSDVGHAMDLIDTAFNTLTITVLRGLLDSTAVANPGKQSLVQQGIPGSSKRHSDDSVVYSESKSRQREARSMRQYKRRGDSFNVGKLNNQQSNNKSGQTRGKLPQSPSESNRQLPKDTNNCRRYDDRLSSPVLQSENLASMNRRRSEGPNVHHSPNIVHPHHAQQLLSMKSSPNLATTDEEYVSDGSRLTQETSRDQKYLAKSSPNLIEEQQNRITKNVSGVDRSWDFNMKQSDSGNFGGRNYSVDVFGSDMNPTRQNMRRSLPAHSLQRYQPDYENVSHLGTAPLRSEKISEIDDIDEVTGRESNPNSPDVKEYDPFRGAGLPTRDPASLKYIKVNQNHEKYPSWPVTKPNGATEQSQPINTRALSMTDHTNTSKEFPKKQQLAYTPGLRPLPEKNSPTAERNTDDGKTRNGSDPGFKSEFVYGLYGRVQRRKTGNTEGRFDDFYNNSKPGYPPPNMDPDGHNIGDKEYNVPSPPERDGKGIDQIELSQKLGSIGNSERTDNAGGSPTAKHGSEIFRPPNQINASTGAMIRPSELNFNTGSSSGGHYFNRTDTGTSPMDKSSPKNPRDMRMGFQFDGLPMQQNRHPSSPHQTRHDRGYQSPVSSPQNQISQPIQRLRPLSQKEQSPGSAVIQRDRSSSQYDRRTHSGKPDIPNFSENGDVKKTYIVKSTPYYNTSTQTETMPYAIKVSNPSSGATKLKHAETQVGGVSTQTSPKTPEEQRTFLEEKSVQARMSRDFEYSEHNFNNKKPPQGNRGLKEEFFRYPSTALTASQASPFKGIQSIQAKYATDEQYDMNTKTESSKAVIPSFSDNASILRKLSEEFYGQKLGLMPDKRMSSSSSQESPRFDPANPVSVLQPGMREAESYSSVVIHHEEKSGLFGGDDVSYVSSSADLRHDISSVFSDSSSNYRNIDMMPLRGRNSFDAGYPNQKAKQFQCDPNMLPSTVVQGYNKESSGPISGSNVLHSSSLRQPSLGGKIVDQHALGASRFDASSIASNSKSVSSDSKSSQSTSVGSNAEPSFGQTSSSSFTSSSANVAGKQLGDDIDGKSRSDRLGSDSVFMGDEGRDSDDLSDYEFSRKPSMRKAYGIYDETERLISQPKMLDTAKSAPERQPSQASAAGVSGSSLPASRMSRYSESSGLGKIQEEPDPGNEFTNDSVGMIKNADEKITRSRPDKLEQYPWQNEAWLRQNVDISTGSNLRRTTSEQIPISRENTSIRQSSYDTDTRMFPKNVNSQSSTFSPSSIPNYENRNIPLSPSAAVSSIHFRTKSDDFPRSNTDSERNKLQQHGTSKLYEHQSLNRSTKDSSSGESSVYESIGINSSESVTDVITKVNEDLAKSAQRVDSIRRSNSSSSRSGSDYMDMSRERNRKETDWSRLRSSASVRYSPDNDRRSSRSSFASENLYEDISNFASITPRSSFAETSDRMFEAGNSNASMDSGLVASPTYQNLPYQRRPPPLPPRTPSPDEKPPALPPRKYRDNQQSNNVGTFPAIPPPLSSLNPSTPPPFHNEKNGINVIPLGKQLKEEKEVDTSKRDFKSLRTQWENSTPREDRYAAELRKQAKKFSGNQQQQQQTQQLNQQQQQQHQQVNAMPAAYERTTTKISYATTFKHEPMQPQEATSPANSSSSSSSASLAPNVSTTTKVSSSFSGASLPLSSSPSTGEAVQGFHPSAFKNNSVASRREGSPASSDSSSTNMTSVRNIPYTANNNTGHGALATSSIVLGSVSQTKTPERTYPQNASRNRSSSDFFQRKPPVIGTPDAENGNIQETLRDRSSSEHDILSDRRQKYQPPQIYANQVTGLKDVTSVNNSKWRPGRSEISPLPSQTKTGQLVEIVTVRDGEFSPPPMEVMPCDDDVQGSSRSEDSERFADESYIGHKNKSSRAIGTYKRSKSAAVLQSGGNNNYKVDGETEKIPFQESKLGQQSWNSESVLSHSDAAVDEQKGAGKGDKTSVSRTGTGADYLGDAYSSTMGRPARPYVHGRHSVGQLQISSSHSSSSSSFASQNIYSSSTSTSVPGSVLTSRPTLADQSISGIRRESPRRGPPPVPADSTYGPNPSILSDKVQLATNSANNLQRPSEGSERGLLNNNSTSHQLVPKKNVLNDTSGDSNSRNPPNNKYSTPPLQTSSQKSDNHSRSVNPALFNDNTPKSATQKEYHRRESAPVRPTAYASSPESKLDVPQGDANMNSRRRSDSSVNTPQRSDHGSYDVSSASHSRQPSQEELECDEKAQQLAKELDDKEQKLSDVLRLDANKKRMQYMDGLFSESMDTTTSLVGRSSSFNQETRSSLKTRSPQHVVDNSRTIPETSKRSSLPKEYWMSPSKALLEMELRKNEEASKDLTKDINDSTTLMKHKEELMEKLHKKLEVLKEEKLSLQQEISDNTLLGQQVCQTVDARCQSMSERDKFKAYIDDLEKIVRLLLNLSGQLARAENAVQALGPNAEAKLKKLTIDKRERLFAKHEEAKYLKEDIDKRSEQLSGVLRERLNENEFSDYTHFIKMKSKLTIELQELEDKITLGEEQILELKKSIPELTTS